MEDVINLHISVGIPGYESIHRIVKLGPPMQELFRSIDEPSNEANVITRAFICTPPDFLKRILEKRNEVAKGIAEAITSAIIEHMSKMDTIMGYPKEQYNGIHERSKK